MRPQAFLGDLRAGGRVCTALRRRPPAPALCSRQDNGSCKVFRLPRLRTCPVFRVFTCVTLSVLQLSAGLYAFKVAVSSDSAFGEGFVNVTVKPGKPARENGLALCGFVSIPGARITSQSISHSYIWILFCSFVFLSEFCVILSPCLTLLFTVAGLPPA